MYVYLRAATSAQEVGHKSHRYGYFNNPLEPRKYPNQIACPGISCS